MLKTVQQISILEGWTVPTSKVSFLSAALTFSGLFDIGSNHSVCNAIPIRPIINNKYVYMYEVKKFK